MSARVKSALMIALVVVVVLVVLAALQARGTDVVGSLSRPFMPSPPAGPQPV